MEQWILTYTKIAVEFLVGRVSIPATVILFLAMAVLCSLPRTKEFAFVWLPIVGFLWFGLFFLRQASPIEYLPQIQGHAYSESDTRLLELYSPMLVLIALGQVVIFYVCIYYTKDIGDLAARDAKSQRFRHSAQWLCWACVALAGTLLFQVFHYPAENPTLFDWDQLAEFNEVLSLITFLLFVLIDFFVWTAAKSDTTSEGCRIRRLAFEAIWVVDVPCVLGVFFLMMLHSILHRWSPQNAYFAHGLSTGAIAFHIAITQAAFAVLKTREIVDHRRSQNGMMAPEQKAATS